MLSARNAIPVAVLIAFLMAPAVVPCAAQVPGVLDAETALNQQQQWLAQEATATLVPYPVPLRNLRRWTIDTRLHRGMLGVAAMSPDSTRVATGNIDGVLRIWDVASGRLEHAVMAHRWSIGRLAWSPDGQMVATQSGADNTVRIFNANTWQATADLPGVFDTIAWSPDSRRLVASGGSSGGLFVSNGLEKFELFKEFGQPISALAWGPREMAVAVASGGVNVIDSSNGRLRLVLDDTESLVTTMVAWSPDGGHIACVGPTSAAVFSASDGKRVKDLGKSGRRVAWSADGKQVAVWDGPGVSIVPFAGEEQPRLLGMSAQSLLAWAQDSTRVVAVDLRQVEVWRTDGERAELTFAVSGGSVPPRFSPGRLLVAGLESPELTLWDPARIQLTRRLEGQGAPITVVEWSPTKKALAFGDAKGSVQIWDADTDAQTAAGPPVTGAVTLLAWSADGKSLAAAGSTGKVQVFSSQTGETSTLDHHQGRVIAVAWGANSTQLATAAADEKILIWDVPAATPRHTITGHGQATALAWQPSTALAAGLSGQGLAIFHPGTGKLFKDVMPRNPDGGTALSDVAWIPGGAMRLLFGMPDHSLVYAIDASSQVKFQRQLSPNGSVRVAALSNGLAITASSDRTVRFWNLADGKLAGFLVDDGGAIVAISATGDVAFDPAAPPDLIAIVDRQDRQEWMPLETFAKACGWKNNPRSIRLPGKK